jgi:glycine/D-amino acid oxidase-like deaminating enzyme
VPPPATNCIVEKPYWWEAAPREHLDKDAKIPDRADVTVIGSGFTGLSAALTLAQAGASVLVLDAASPGYGASTRNAGFISRALKHSFGSLMKTRGEKDACRLYSETHNSFHHLLSLINELDIDCQLQHVGRVRGAGSPEGYEKMAREVELRNRYLGEQSYVVPRSNQHLETSIDLFHGVQVVPDYKNLHPGLLHSGLLAAARSAGVAVLGYTPVTGIRRDGSIFEVATPRGRVASRNVLLATNGYTPSGLGDWHRRVIPFDAYIIATNEMTPDQITRALPTNRATSDSAFNLDFIRSSPDSTRLLIGGLTGRLPRDVIGTGQDLRRRLIRYFPSLSDATTSHVWTGKCAGTFDMLPHVGHRDGIHYATGYCFAGVSMGTYLGHKVAKKILGKSNADTAFDDQPLEKRSFYYGQRWLVPLAMTYYNYKDRQARTYKMP